MDTPDQPPGDFDPQEFVTRELAARSGDVITGSASDVAQLALEGVLMTGVSVCVCMTHLPAPTVEPESLRKARSFLFLLSGLNIPPDVIANLESYCRGVLQDYENGNRDIKTISKFNHDLPPDAPTALEE